MMTARDFLSAERARELLEYNPDTGELRWRVSRGRVKAGAIVKSKQMGGYVQVGIDSRVYLAHLVIYLIVTGSWPKDEIDHRDLDKANNRWGNLRPATRLQNLANQGAREHNFLQTKGVSVSNSRRNPYRVGMKINGRMTHIGCFPTLDSAHKAYERYAVIYHGEFARAS